MNKIRQAAWADRNQKPTYGSIDRQARRVLFWERAYRYQRAANMMLVEMINACQQRACGMESQWGVSPEKHDAAIEKLSQKRAWVMGQATAYYERAATI